MTLRELLRDEVDAIARAVADQPLLQRYGTTAEKLARGLAEAIERGDPVIAVEEGGVVHGFAWFLPTGTFAIGGYLRLIALVPGAEGRGLGAALLDEVERRVAARSRTLFLLVSHWNEGARRFYARRGYAEVGRLPGFVRDDTDEIVCMKRVTS
jgi:ribosomal protein S18 acetylase RimI-like enzyme